MHGGVEPSIDLQRLQKRLDRERAARIEAESVAEKGLRDLYAHKEQIRLLQRIAATANLSSEISEALAFAVREVCEFTGWVLGHAYLYSDETCSLRPADIWHPPAQGFDEFRAATNALEFTVGVGLPGRVLATGLPAWIGNIDDDDNFSRAPCALASGLRAAFAFPVLVGSEVAGALEFFSLAPQESDPALLEIMGQIGVQLGRVIERKRSEDRLIHDASHDALTGLANRALFQDRLARVAKAHASGASEPYAVLFIDLDRFKLVNDSLGHAVGDDLIIVTAQRLQATIDTCLPRHHALLARLGGDEFTALLECITGPADAVRIAERIQDAVSEPFSAASQTIQPCASIGVAYAGDGQKLAADVLRDADIAMYRAKASGRNRIEVFDTSMHTEALKRLCLENDLRRALANEEFVVHFQPIVALGSTRIAGFEALVRWQRGAELVYPSDFITVAEETGLIIFLGEWVLRQACNAIAQWSVAEGDLGDLTISVNVSPRHFAQRDFVDRVTEIISAAGIAPTCIRLELTESVTIVDAERTIDVLSSLRKLGVRIAIDDFGTGYSSLSYLQKLPLDVLKIDKSFVLAMRTDPGSRQIIQTIMSLAHGLGMDVVAEGTETASHVLDLAAMGCKFGQGHFFSRAVDEETARALLRNGFDQAIASAS